MTKQSISFSVNPEVFIYSDKNNTYEGKYIGKVARLISKNKNSCLLLLYGEHILVDSHDVITMVQKKLIDDAIENEIVSRGVSRVEAIKLLSVGWLDAIGVMLYYLGQD